MLKLVPDRVPNLGDSLGKGPIRALDLAQIFGLGERVR